MAGRLQGRGRHLGHSKTCVFVACSLSVSGCVAGGGTEFVFSPVVAMNDVLGVRGGKYAGELPADGERLFLAQSATALLQSL